MVRGQKLRRPLIAFGVASYASRQRALSTGYGFDSQGGHFQEAFTREGEVLLICRGLWTPSLHKMVTTFPHPFENVIGPIEPAAPAMRGQLPKRGQIGQL